MGPQSVFSKMIIIVIAIIILIMMTRGVPLNDVSWRGGSQICGVRLFRDDEVT